MLEVFLILWRHRTNFGFHKYEAGGGSMKKQDERRNGKITHVMANGEVRDSVAGYVKSVDQLPETARRLLYDMIQGKCKKNDTDIH